MQPFKTGMVAEELPQHVARNRKYWDSQADDYVRAAERHWAQTDPTWGIWEVPESELHLLPDRLEGIDVIELGCGTAYVSGWLARRIRWQSTIRPGSSKPRGACSASTG